MYRRPARLRTGSLPGRRLGEDNEGVFNPDTGMKFGYVIPCMLANSFMNVCMLCGIVIMCFYVDQSNIYFGIF